MPCVSTAKSPVPLGVRPLRGCRGECRVDRFRGAACHVAIRSGQPIRAAADLPGVQMRVRRVRAESALQQPLRIGIPL